MVDVPPADTPAAMGELSWCGFCKAMREVRITVLHFHSGAERQRRSCAVCQRFVKGGDRP